MENALSNLSSEDLGTYLLSKGIPQDVIDNLQGHAVDGESLIAMNNDHIKEVAPRIVDRIKLGKVISELKVW